MAYEVRVFLIIVVSARTRLSKSLVTDPTKLEWRSAADLKIKYNTTVRIGVVSRAINER